MLVKKFMIEMILFTEHFYKFIIITTGIQKCTVHICNANANAQKKLEGIRFRTFAMSSAFLSSRMPLALTLYGCRGAPHFYSFAFRKLI